MNRLVLSAAGAWLSLSVSACAGTSGDGSLPGSGGAAPTGGGSGTGAGVSTGGAVGSGGGLPGTGGAATGGSSGAGDGGTSSGGSPGGSGGVGGGSGGSGAAATGGQGGTAGTGGTGAGGSGGEPVVRPDVVISGPQAFWQESVLTEAGGGNATVTVNDAQELQTWLGFGGTFNEKGWDALAALTDSQRDEVIKLLFSPSEGANFAWGRIPMGASDYAMERYSLNETKGDYAMANFSIDQDRKLLIPYIKAALAVKPNIRFWGSPWTPPSWMKDHESFDGTNLLPDSSNQGSAWEAQMLSDDQTLTAYALYFAKFIEEYEKEGIHISHVEPQNEPGYVTRYPSCKWAPGLLGKFVGDYLGPTLEAHNLTTEIWFGTLSNDTTYSGHIGGLTGKAEGYVTGVGLQWNTLPNVKTLADRGFLVLQTEHKCGNFPWVSSQWNPNMPQNDHTYGVDSWGWIKEWVTGGVNAYSAWNMVLDTEGKNIDLTRPWPQNALIVVDRQAKTYTKTPAYYVFRHLSYFVDPGAVRVATSGGDALAFKNLDGSLVAVVYNGSQAGPTTVAVGGKTVQVQIPAQGWATIHIKG